MNRRTVAPRPARWPLLLAIVLSAAALATLLWLRARLVAEEQAQLRNATRVFEELVLRPENDALDFSAIESSAANFTEGSDVIGELFVSKQTSDRGEVLVHPYYYSITTPNWRESLATWQRIALGPTDQPHGWLYVRIAASNRRAVDSTIGVFGAFMLLCLAVFVFRTRGKEIELGRTVSELEERKAEVIRLERLALAGQLSANIFHDIKKPVLNIKHEATDLLEQEGLGSEARDRIDSVREQTELFFKMLRELGFEHFVRAEKEGAEYCDVRQMIERSLALVKYEQGDVEVRLPEQNEPLPLVLAPPHRLVQLFSNLILNAYQALGQRGSLEIGVSSQAGEITVRLRDNGPGVPEELRSEIFNPFVTTKPAREGSGLGLYICSQIARDLGGSIRLAETGPGGSTFEVRLPHE